MKDCICNTSTGQWINCQDKDDNEKHCPSQMPNGKKNCTCDTSSDQWINCQDEDDEKHCPSQMPNGKKNCTCDTSTGQWINCQDVCNNSADSCNGYFFNCQCTSLKETVTFGHYPQNYETPEPIEWIVLAARENSILLLSKYVIDAKAFDSSHLDDWGFCNYPTWAESDIRKWLNDDSQSGFLSIAFDNYELDMILEVTNATSYYDSISGGSLANDRVFLLDRSEAENTNLFPTDEDRMADATPYTISKGVYNKYITDTDEAFLCTRDLRTANWWLRSPGYNHITADLVRADGWFGNLAIHVEDTKVGIRPALWVRYE